MSYIGVEKIIQKDKERFAIHWTDGLYQEFTLKKLQENCPCTRCENQLSSISPTLSASRIYSFGRYALKVDFSTGCSSGIYTFTYLRQLGV